MENLMLKLCGLRTVNKLVANKLCKKLFGRHYTNETPYKIKKEHIRHPYRKIHPWKSRTEFSQYLIQNVICNIDGLVAINKPYGISAMRTEINNTKESLRQKYIQMGEASNYTIAECLGDIAKSQGYSDLRIIKTPERYTSGIMLLAADPIVENSIIKAYDRAVSIGVINSTYWIITTKLPREISGKKRLAIGCEISPNGKEKKSVLLQKWSHNAEKEHRVKIINIEFKLLANSTKNLSSLIEIKTTKTARHAIRLFAATILYSPILGDNIAGPLIQKVMGKYVSVSPFSPVTEQLPKLNPDLLKLLHLTPSKQELIPAHIHLKRIYLPAYGKGRKDLTIEAPLIHPFDWTYKELEFEDESGNTENQEAVVTM